MISTLLVMTTTGVWLKIDPNNNGAILSQVGTTSAPAFGTSGGVIDNKAAGGFLSYEAIGGAHGCSVQAAFKGRAQNGILFAPALSGPDVLVVETSGFQNVATYDFSLYPNKPQGGSTNWPSTGLQYSGGGYIYDTMANALLAVSNAIAPAGFATTYAVYRAYLDRLSTNGLTADAIVQQICELATIPDANIDTTRLTGIQVEGYPVTSLTAGKDMINTLGQAYFFEGRESDFKIQFIPRGQPSVLTIPETDLGLLGDSCELNEMIGQEQDMPKDVEILYIDPLQDYQQGQQKKIRHSKTKKTYNQTSISLPLVMTAQQAAQLADKIMWTAENERRTYKTNMWKALYILLDPCDVVTFDYHGAQLTARVSGNTIGQNFAIELDMTNEDVNTYASVAQGTAATGFVGQTIPTQASTLLWLLDIPYLQDTDSDAAGNIGYYFVMAPSSAGSSWPAGVLYSSSDNAAYNQIDASTLAVTYGVAQVALPAPPLGPDVWDMTSQLTLRMISGEEPTSDTMLNVLNGKNAAILYPSLEIIQFTTVVQNADGTVTLSGLLRGRRGTDVFVNAHTTGEYVFFPLFGGTVHEQVSLSLLNALRYYKAITVGSDLNSNKLAQPVSLQGRDLQPYSVAAFYNAPSGSDILFTWVRRTRLGGGMMDGSGQVPLCEGTEAYDIDILNGAGTVVRTFAGITPPGGIPDSWTTPSQPHQLYTAAQQATDGYLSGHGWAAICYQISSQVGRGFPKTVALP